MFEERVEPLTAKEAPRAAHLSLRLRLLQGAVVVEKVEHQLVPIRDGRGGGVRPRRRKEACTCTPGSSGRGRGKGWSM